MTSLRSEYGMNGKEIYQTKLKFDALHTILETHIFLD